MVLPHLEYGSEIWDTAQQCYCNMLETVQHKFPRYVSFIANVPMSLLSQNCDPILSLLTISTLEHRESIADLVFLFKTMNGIIVMLVHIRTFSTESTN